jgi:DNA-binding response OmpR family regulator
MSPVTSPPALRTVLIVDDEPMIRTIARTALTIAGFAVREAEGAEDTREALRTAARPFDLVLLDLSLAGESGAHLIPEIRQRSPGSRILVVSGATEDDVTEYGVDGFLGKPFTRAKLLDAIQRTLGTDDPSGTHTPPPQG